MNKAFASLDILYVGTLPPHNGGTATVGALILEGLARNGHRVRAIVAGLQTQAGINDHYARTHPQIQIERFIVPYFESSPDVPPSDDYRAHEGEQIRNLLNDCISQRRPDLILIGRETFALHVPDIANQHSIPTILLIHGTTIAGIQNKTIPENRAHQLLQQFYKTDRVIAVAQNLATSARALGLKNLQVIENAADEELFCPAPEIPRLRERLGIAKDRIIVTHLSNFKRLKRAPDLLQAAQKALKDNPLLFFLMVGGGNTQPEVEKSCHEMNLQHAFRFTGWIDHPRVPDYLNLSDMIVMPSQREARAMVFLETQACGRLLIASDIPSAREVIEDGVTGLLFPVGNIDEIANKVLYAANNAELRKKIGHNARQSTLKRPLKMFVDQYETAIQEVVAQYQPS